MCLRNMLKQKICWRPMSRTILLLTSSACIIVFLWSSLVSSDYSNADLCFSNPTTKFNLNLRSPHLTLRNEMVTTFQTRRPQISSLVAQWRGGSTGYAGGRGGGRRPVGRDTRRVEQPKGPPMNRDITFPSMRVVVSNPEGKDMMLGILSREEALEAAAERGQDLIVISPDSDPPVCKIINFDKLRYETEKKEKLKKKNQKSMDMKEVKLSVKIDVHDYEVRKRSALKFLLKGDKVKASIRFKGREVAHKDLGQKTLMNLIKDCEKWAKVDQKPMMEGRQMIMVLTPLPEVLKMAEKERKARLLKRKQEVEAAGGDASAVTEDDDDDDEDEDLLDDDDDDDDDDDGEDEVEEAAEEEYDLEALSQDDLEGKIAQVGERVRTLKANGSPKNQVAAGVDELLALKARFQELTSTSWDDWRQTRA